MNSEIKNKPPIEEKEVALQIDFVREFEKRMREIPNLPIEQREGIIVNNKEIIEINKTVPSIIFSFIEPFTRKLELWIADIKELRPHHEVEGNLRSLLYRNEIYQDLRTLTTKYAERNKTSQHLTKPTA